MRCKKCNKEFPETNIEHRSYDNKRMIEYGSISYSYHPICPYCGYDNGLKVRM